MLLGIATAITIPQRWYLLLLILPTRPILVRISRPSLSRSAAVNNAGFTRQSSTRITTDTWSYMGSFIASHRNLRSCNESWNKYRRQHLNTSAWRKWSWKNTKRQTIVDLKETKKNSNICIRSWHISRSWFTILIRVAVQTKSYQSQLTTKVPAAGRIITKFCKPLASKLDDDDNDKKIKIFFELYIFCCYYTASTKKKK